MVRSLIAFLLVCLSAQPVFAGNINWQERVQRFSQYVEKQSIAQGRRTRALAAQAESFSSRVDQYVKRVFR